jgi:hypothetical protein
LRDFTSITQAAASTPRPSLWSSMRCAIGVNYSSVRGGAAGLNGRSVAFPNLEQVTPMPSRPPRAACRRA